MTIASIAQHDVVTIDADATLQQTAQLMRDRHVGSVAVVRDGDGTASLIGMVTDRDLALRALAEGADPRSAVRTLCHGPLVAMPDSGSIAEAASLMRSAGVHRLLLVDRKQRLAGIVSFDDLIAAYADQLGDLAEALDAGIEREVQRGAADVEGPGDAPVVVPTNLAEAWQDALQP